MTPFDHQPTSDSSEQGSPGGKPSGTPSKATQGETKKQGGITKSEDRKQETKAAEIEVIAGLERAIAQKELVIDRFRERVMTLEQEVEKLQLEANNQESMQILMDSLQ